MTALLISERERRIRVEILRALAEFMQAYTDTSRPFDAASVSDAIATRAAKELAGATVGLSDDERNALSYLIGWCGAGQGDPGALRALDTVERLLERDLTGKPAAELSPQLKPATASIGPVCSTCNDTHAMDLNGAVVMCTRCPVPCESCRQREPGFGPGAYCSATPCACACHRRSIASPGGRS